MARIVKVVNDFEDCDDDWKMDPKQIHRNHHIPLSTQTGKIVMREIAQGKIVIVEFDDGFHLCTKCYLQAMCEEYSLPLFQENSHRWILSPQPKVTITAVTDDPEEIER